MVDPEYRYPKLFFFKVTPALNIAPFLVSMLNFWGVRILICERISLRYFPRLSMLAKSCNITHAQLAINLKETACFMIRKK